MSALPGIRASAELNGSAAGRIHRRKRGSVWRRATEYCNTTLNIDHNINFTHESGKISSLQKNSKSFTISPSSSSSRVKNNNNSSFSSTKNSAIAIALYVITDNRRNSRVFHIGLATLAIVVLFSVLSCLIFVRSPLVFLKIADDETGSMDLAIISKFSSNSILANYTAAGKALANALPIAIASFPRWGFPINVTEGIRADQTAAILLAIDSEIDNAANLAPAWPLRPLAISESHVTSSLLRLFSLRPQAGDRITIKFDLLGVIPNGTAIGQTTFIDNDIFAWLTFEQVINACLLTGASPIDVWINSRQSSNNESNPKRQISLLRLSNGTLRNFTNIVIPLAVIDALNPETVGKYQTGLGNVVMVEQHATELLMLEFIRNLLKSPLFGAINIVLKSSDLNNFSLMDYVPIVGIIAPDRVNMYSLKNSEIWSKLVLLSNRVAAAMSNSSDRGKKSYDLQNPVFTVFTMFAFFRIFMGEMFFTIIVMLCGLSALLIFALLLADAEQKTFEYSILRTLGLSRHALVAAVLFSAILFSFPAIAIGLLACSIVYLPIDQMLGRFAAISVQLRLDSSSASVGIVLAIVLPTLGILLPIRRAMRLSLRNTLDLYRHASTQTKGISLGTISRLGEMGVRLDQLLAALLASASACFVYYAGPYAFLFERQEMFFRILTVFLLGFMLGLVLLGYFFLKPLERLILSGMMRFLNILAPVLKIIIKREINDSKISIIVKKNLSAHSRRNRLTSITFTSCLAFVICTGSMFELQRDFVADGVAWLIGADILVSASGMENSLPETKLESFLRQSPEIVENFTFVTWSLSDFQPTIQSTRVAPLCVNPTIEIDIFGVEKRFGSASLERYYNPVTIGIPDNNAKKSTELFSNLQENNIWTISGAQVIPLLLPEGLANSIGVNTESRLSLQIGYRENGMNRKSESSYKTFLSRGIAIMRKVPAFPGISLAGTTRPTALISMQSFQSILENISQLATRPELNFKIIEWDENENNLQNITNLPKARLLIKLTEYASKSTRRVEPLVNSLGSLLGDNNIKITVLNTKLSETASASDFINTIFTAVTAIGVSLAFVVLWLSVDANVRENKWEIGVLRSLGLEKKQSSEVARIYVYEALVVVLAAICIGTIAGGISALLITLQNTLYTELSIQLAFPWVLHFVVVIMSLLTTILGSWFLSIEACKHQIAITLKGN